MGYRLRPAESLVTSVAAGKDPPFVLDQPTAVVGENRWPIDLPYPLLLAAAGREPSNAAIFLKHGATDCGPATATGSAILGGAGNGLDLKTRWAAALEGGSVYAVGSAKPKREIPV